MYKELTAESITDIILFFRENAIGASNDSDHIIGFSCMPNRFEVRALRNAFFNYEVYGMGEYDADELIDLILIDIPKSNRYSYGSIMICGKFNTELLNKTSEQVFEQYSQINKIKLVTVQSNISSKWEGELNEIGYKKEICLRKYEDEEIVVYSKYK